MAATRRLTGAAGLAGAVLFAAGLRGILEDVTGDGVLGTTAFGGALLVVATGLGAETINMAGAARRARPALRRTGRALFETSYVLGYNAAGVGVGILMLAVAGAALCARSLLPRWLALVLTLVGLAFLTPLSRFLLAPSLLLLFVASAQLLRGSGIRSPHLDSEC
jgi:hypothetical protein